VNRSVSANLDLDCTVLLFPKKREKKEKCEAIL